jgi:hypothetical protein
MPWETINKGVTKQSPPPPPPPQKGCKNKPIFQPKLCNLKVKTEKKDIWIYISNPIIYRTSGEKVVRDVYKWSRSF